MTAGHLRSQIRYYSLKKAVSLDEQSLVLNTRNTNALDFALLIQELVPLLEAYEHAWHSDDRHKRLELADAICQGISPDPELFLNRVELLGAYSMIEHLFITTDRDGHAVYTPWGRDTFGCFRSTRHGSVAWRSRCLTIVRTSGRLPALIRPMESCTGFRPISSNTWRSKPCSPMPSNTWAWRMSSSLGTPASSRG